MQKKLKTYCYSILCKASYAQVQVDLKLRQRTKNYVVLAGFENFGCWLELIYVCWKTDFDVAIKNKLSFLWPDNIRGLLKHSCTGHSFQKKEKLIQQNKGKTPIGA